MTVDAEDGPPRWRFPSGRIPVPGRIGGQTMRQRGGRSLEARSPPLLGALLVSLLGEIGEDASFAVAVA